MKWKCSECDYVNPVQGPDFVCQQCGEMPYTNAWMAVFPGGDVYLLVSANPTRLLELCDEIGVFPEQPLDMIWNGATRLGSAILGSLVDQVAPYMPLPGMQELAG